MHIHLDDQAISVVAFLAEGRHPLLPVHQESLFEGGCIRPDHLVILLLKHHLLAYRDRVMPVVSRLSAHELVVGSLAAGQPFVDLAAEEEADPLHVPRAPAVVALVIVIHHLRTYASS